MKYLYLDQKDISFLAKGSVESACARLLRTLVDDGQVAVVLTPMVHAYETSKCAPELRQRIVDYVDGLTTRRWLWQSVWIERAEVHLCFEQDTQGLSSQPVAPFTTTILEIYGITDPARVSGGWDLEHEFSESVKMCDPAQSKQAQRLREMQTVYPALSRMSRLTTRGASVTDYFRREQLWMFVPQRTSAGLHLSERDRREYASELDLKRCPSLALSLQVEDKLRADDDAHAGTGDIPDDMHLHAIPYCDMVTLDSRMHNTVRQTVAGKTMQSRLAHDLPEALHGLGYTW